MSYEMLLSPMNIGTMTVKNRTIMSAAEVSLGQANGKPTEKLMAYYDVLQSYNATALVPVELDETAQAFFDKIVILNGCMDDDRLFAETLFTA